MFKWKDNYSCNVEEIDNQHRRLFEIGNNIYELLLLDEKIDKYDDIQKGLMELKDYTIYHFDSEEKLMDKHGYENLENHKIEHIAFIKKIEEFCSKDIDEDQQEAVMDMLTFIANWIEKHILGTDHKYKDFFNEKGVY